MTDADRIDLALQAAAAHWGRNWKQELTAAWANGRYPSNLDSGTLQGIRNACWGGAKWLYDTYRLPKTKEDEQRKQAARDRLENETWQEFTERRSPDA